MKLSIDQLIRLEAELARFTERVELAKSRMLVDKFAVHGCKETGSLRRGAIDIKNELTKITQSKGY